MASQAMVLFALEQKLSIFLEVRMQKRFKVEDERLGSKELVLDMGSMFNDPALYLDGEWLNVNSGQCRIVLDNGEEVSVEFLKRHMDRYPSVLIGDECHTFVAPLTWYDKIALLLPVVLVVPFGFFGIIAFIGLWLFNGRMFREVSPGEKWAIHFGTLIIVVLSLFLFAIPRRVIW